MNKKEQDGLEELLKEAREEEVKLGQKKAFKRLWNILGALVFINVMPFSIYFLLRGDWGKAIAIDILILQLLAIPFISILLATLLGIIPFNRWLYRKRVYLSYLYLMLAFSTILFLSFLINFLFIT